MDQPLYTPVYQRLLVTVAMVSMPANPRGDPTVPLVWMLHGCQSLLFAKPWRSVKVFTGPSGGSPRA